MKPRKYILTIIKRIETLYPNVICYAYLDGNEPMTHRWWSLCISDYNVYMNDERFKKLSSAWHKGAIAQGIKLIFFYCNPQEKKLFELADKDNLIMNI